MERPDAAGISHCSCRFVTAYRNKYTGKLMIAAHYGKRAWFFPCRLCREHRKSQR